MCHRNHKCDDCPWACSCFELFMRIVHMISIWLQGAGTKKKANEIGVKSGRNNNGTKKG